MTIVADSYQFVVGVDTHARTHTFTILTTTTPVVIASQTFPTTQAGMTRALTWITRRTSGATLIVIEGVGSYGATLARLTTTAGYPIVEAHPIPRRMRAGRGKSDVIDAELIARSVLGIDTTLLRHPREDTGIQASLRVLITARDTMTTQRTAMINALTALLRTVNLSIDLRRGLTTTHITTISSWRARNEPLEIATARNEAIRLAKQVSILDKHITENKTHIETLIASSPARGLLTETGIGPVTAAVSYLAWSHKGRIHSEAGYAALAGTSPIPASSGNTIRYRLNRGGDRRLNSALHMATIVRMTPDPETRAYVNKRSAEGKTPREIRRILKRYLARHIYRHLNNATTPTTT
jgi:transposase